MSTVNLSSASRTGLTVLRNVQKQMTETQNRLVTGKAVNSPIDNATKFFNAAAMDNRAAALDALQDSVTTAQATVKAGSEGIKGLQNMIKQARSLANQAIQSGVDNAKVTGTVTSLTGATALAPAAGNTITISDGTTTYTYDNNVAHTTVDDLIEGINSNAALKVNASLKDGALVLEGEAGATITVGGTWTAGLTTLGLTAGATAPEVNETRKNLAAQFDSIRTEIDQLIGDASVGGVNLLKGDNIKLSLNETGTSTHEITGTSLSAAGLGIAAATGDFQTNGAIEDALDDLDAASKSLEAQAASLGGSSAIIEARVDFNRQMSDILKTGANDIVAADMDQEAANLVALQTRQQMAATSLSIIQSSEATALRLIS